MEDKKVLLSIKDLQVKFRVRGRILTAIRGVTLDIYENESIAIVGESGAGKSVFTKAFAGMLDSNGFIDQGDIIFNDAELSDTVVPLNSYAKKTIASTWEKLNDYSKLEYGSEVFLKMKALEQEKEEKIFPGYVLVEMIMDEDSWYVVRHTAGVTKFVGSAKKPIPAKDSEIKKIIHRSTTQTQKIEMDVKVGEKVRIISGPFAEFVGDITEVYPDKAKLRAMVSIFGRETPVELEYKQIQKL